MKTAFCCLNLKLRGASFVVLYIHLILFAWMLLAMMFRSWIILVLILVFLAGIVSVHTKNYMNITLTTATVILFVIAFIIAASTLFVNFGALVLVSAMTEWIDASEQELYDDGEDDSLDSFQLRNSGNRLVKTVAGSYVALFIFDLIFFSIIAFYVYSGLVLNSYKNELKLQPQPSVIFGSAPVPLASASYVVQPHQIPSYSYHPANNMSHVQFGFGSRCPFQPQPQHQPQCKFDKQPLV